MSRAERAKELFIQGYACSQAVIMAFADLMNADEEFLLKASLPFGGGLSRLRLTCGAVSGMAMVVGLLFSKFEISAENKKQTYHIVQELCARLEGKLGSINCAELLNKANLAVEVGGTAEARTPDYYKKRPCGDIVATVAAVLEEYLDEQGIL